MAIPKIIIDQNDKCCNPSHPHQLTTEEYYDLLHHTHSGIGSGSGTPYIDDTEITNLKNEINSLKNTITSLQSIVSDLQTKNNTLTTTLTTVQQQNETLTTQVNQIQEAQNNNTDDLFIGDWDLTTPGTQTNP